MRIAMDLEDTFGDIIGKAARGSGVSMDALAARAHVSAKRLESFLDYASEPTEDEARVVAALLRLDPVKLADIGLGRWKPIERELAPFIAHQNNSPHKSNGYFIMPNGNGGAAFVDPGGDADNVERTLRERDATLEYLLVTHKHFDHTDALADLRKRFPAAKVVVHALDAHELGQKAAGAIAIEDGGSLPFGSGEVRTMHTPGHTDGSSCFVYRGHVFTGDILFAGSVGRCFGQQHGYADLLHSIATKVLTLPPETVIFPGHGPPTTVAEERAHNPFF